LEPLGEGERGAGGGRGKHDAVRYATLTHVEDDEQRTSAAELDALRDALKTALEDGMPTRIKPSSKP
jgi:hypothetical protein